MILCCHPVGPGPHPTDLSPRRRRNQAGLFDSRFCSFHHSQTRHCKNAVDIASSKERGLKRDFSVFRGKGCLQTSSILRPISRPHRNTLEEIESYSELVDSVRSHSGDALGAKDVFRRQACGTCRYVLHHIARSMRTL